MHAELSKYLEQNNIPTHCKRSHNRSYVTAILEGYEASGLSKQTFYNYINKYFPDKPKNVNFKTWLLNKVFPNTFEPKSNLERFLKNYFEKNNIPIFGGSNFQYNYILAISEPGLNTVHPRVFSAFTKNYFPDKPDRVYLKTWIPFLENKKLCCDCEEVLSCELFGKDSSVDGGLSRRCKVCAYSSSKEYSREITAKRNAAKLQRTPKWVSEKAIKNFYKNCPAGYEVDHIIPLQGKNVSGLHTIDNLQYLSREENRKKSNKFIVE